MCNTRQHRRDLGSRRYRDPSLAKTHFHQYAVYIREGWVGEEKLRELRCLRNPAAVGSPLIQAWLRPYPTSTASINAKDYRQNPCKNAGLCFPTSILVRWVVTMCNTRQHRRDLGSRRYRDPLFQHRGPNVSSADSRRAACTRSR